MIELLFRKNLTFFCLGNQILFVLKQIKRRIKFVILFLVIILIISKENSSKEKEEEEEEEEVNIKNNSWIIFYRIIGNDFVSINCSNETLINLKFILQYEFSFENVKKIWILNRIVDKEFEEILINILNSYNYFFIRIPFHSNEYHRIPYYIPFNYPSQEFFYSNNFSNMSSIEKIQLVYTIYHYKNLYAINRNGAKNFALKHGKQEMNVKWLMPFHRNSFLSEENFNKILHIIKKNSSIEYLIIPNHKIINNSQVFYLNQFQIYGEPQIIFRYNSKIEYLQTLTDEQDSNEEILSYLGMKNYSLKKSRWEEKEREALNISKDKHEYIFQNDTLIFHLSSFNKSIDEQSLYHRTCNHYQQTLYFLHNLDLKISSIKLLPNPQTNSDPCAFWSDKNIENIIRRARNMIIDGKNLEPEYH
ncbi:unnamed protein product [Adineta steineri]|uniref:Uncharacterized protein n=1 Tax=Adineta steineri TaxID=433720 RepID=A0A813ZLL8_9BILA|nr:unnamed protein product [Adineta steineri]CAF3541456.1 unnamed protein product [Adineta steineri]